MPLVYVLPGKAARVWVFAVLWLYYLLLLGLYVLRGNTALSRGWCTPLTRGSAVCEQNASHNTQILACFPHQLD